MKLLTRQKKVCDRRRFNCGGYALGTFDWFDFNDVDLGYINFENPNAFNKAMHNMELYFPFLRRIQNIDEAKRGEIVIAFRVGNDYDDFHFMRRARNGIWYEKRGSCMPIFIVPKKEVFAQTWRGIYDSPLGLFIDTRETV